MRTMRPLEVTKPMSLRVVVEILHIVTSCRLRFVPTTVDNSAVSIREISPVAETLTTLGESASCPSIPAIFDTDIGFTSSKSAIKVVLRASPYF